MNRALGVQRLILLTDRFLPGDHRDVDATIGNLKELGESCCSLAQDDVVDHALSRCADGDDDTTLLVVGRTESGSWLRRVGASALRLPGWRTKKGEVVIPTGREPVILG